MATSRYSYLRQYAPYISPYNVDVIKDVMAYKQGRVDANRARMYEQIDYLMGQELAKPQDREYLRTRMSDTIARINEQFDGVDLSSDGVTRAIQGEISSVLDDKVINAIAGTREYQNLMRQIEDIRTNKPQYYSPINDQEAQMPYFNWLNDGKVGSRLGALHYTPYYDYTSEITKQIKDYREANKGKKVQVPVYGQDGNQTGTLIEMNIDQMSDAQIRSFGLVQINGRAAEQMRIEANYLARTNQMFHNPAAFATYATDYLTRFDREVNALEAKMNSLGDESIAKTLYGSQLQEAKNLRASMRSNVNSLISNYSPQAAAQFVIQNNFLDGLASTWKYDNTSFERKKDEAYYAYQQEKRAQEEFTYNLMLTKANIEGQQLQNRLDQLRVGAAENNPLLLFSSRNRSSGSGSSGSGTTPEGYTSIFLDTPPVSVDQGATLGNRNLVQEFSDKIVADGTARRTNLESFYARFTRDHNDDVQEILAAASANPEIYGGMTPQETVYQWLKNNNDIKTKYLNGSDREEIRALYESIRDYDDEILNNEDLISSAERIGVFNSLDDYSNEIGASMLGVNSGFGIGNKRRDLGDAVLIASLIGGRISPQTYPTTAPGGSASSLARPTDYATVRTNGNGTLFTSILKRYSDRTGERFNPSDYFIIEGEDVRLKSGITVDENTPTIVRNIIELMNDGSAMGFIRRNSDAIEDVANQTLESFNRELANSTFSRGFRKFVWTSGMTGDLKEQFDRMYSMYTGKVTGLGQVVNDEYKKATETIELGVSYEGGQLKRYLVRNGDFGTAVEITDQELIQNGIPNYVSDGKYRVEDYESGYADITFADYKTAWGPLYAQRLEEDLLIKGVSYKSQFKNTLQNLVQTRASLFSQEGLQEMNNIINELVDLSDQLTVKNHGEKNGRINNMIIEFYDRDDKGNRKARPIVAQTQRVDGDFADWHHHILRQAPQKFYVDFVTEALMQYLELVAKNKAINKQLSNGIITDDCYLNDLLIFGRRKRNAGREQQQ